MTNTDSNRENLGTLIKETIMPRIEPRQAEFLYKLGRDLIIALFNSTPIGLYIVQDGLFRYANPRFLEVTGYDEDELIDTNSLDLVHPDDRDMVRQEAVKMLKGRSSGDYEYRVISKSGQIKWILETVSSIIHENHTATLGHFMDITERKQAEEKLRESRKRFMDMVNFLPQTIWEMDETGRLTFSSYQGAQTYGRDLEDIQKGLNILEACVPEDRDRMWENAQRIMSGEELGGIEYTELRKDGSTFPAIIHATPIILGNRPVGLRGLTIDITERKQADEALAMKSILLEAATETSLDGILAIDDENKILLSNKRFQEMWQIPQELIDAKDNGPVLEHVASLVIDDPETFTKDVYNLFEQEKKGVIDRQERWLKNGKILDRYSSPLLDINGEYRGRIWYFQDITERRHAEEELRIKNSAVASSINAIAIADLEGNLIYVNNAFLQMWGYSDSKEVLGKPTLEFWQLQGKALAVIETLKERGSWIGELVARGKNGRVFDVQLSASLVQNENEEPICLMASFIDITKRKRTEEALRESEKRFRDLVELLPETVFEMDAEGNLTFANEAAFNTFGLSPEQPNSGSPVLQIITPEDRERAGDDIQRLLNGEKLGGIEYTAVKKDGNKIPVNIYASRTIRGNKAAGLRGIIVDISRHKQIEKELKETLNKLEHSNTELEQFAYVASHDLQEPLRMVASYTQLLARRYQGQLDADADEFISYAVDGAHRMQKLITDLLAYSRVSTRSKPFEMTDCETVVDQALSNLQIPIEEASTVITRDPLPNIMADSSQLVRVFQNIIGNAIKFRQNRAPEIHIGAEQSGGEWVFSVRDNGIGIDPQNANRIFTIFQRLHSTVEYPGTGIGLSICKKIIERHGGRIWVEPNDGNGSTFCFTNPAQGDIKP